MNKKKELEFDSIEIIKKDYEENCHVIKGWNYPINFLEKYVKYEFGNQYKLKQSIEKAYIITRYLFGEPASSHGHKYWVELKDKSRLKKTNGRCTVLYLEKDTLI